MASDMLSSTYALPLKTPMVPKTITPIALLLTAAVGCSSNGPSGNSPTDTIVVDGALFWREDTGRVGMLKLPHGSALVAASPPATGSCIGNLLANATHIYWTDCTGFLWRVTRAGDQQENVGIRTGFSFAVDDENVYYPSSQGTLLKQPFTASQPAMELSKTVLTIHAVAVYGDTAYVAAATGSPFEQRPPIGIFKMPVAGGGDATLAVMDTFEAAELIAETSGLYWGSDAVRHAQLDGTGLSTFDGRGGFYLRVSNQRVFWYTGESIISAALDGTDQIAHRSSTSRDLVGPGVEPHVLHIWESDEGRVTPVYHLVDVSY